MTTEEKELSDWLIKYKAIETANDEAVLLKKMYELKHLDLSNDEITYIPNSLHILKDLVDDDGGDSVERGALRGCADRVGWGRSVLATAY